MRELAWDPGLGEITPSGTPVSYNLPYAHFAQALI